MTLEEFSNEFDTMLNSYKLPERFGVQSEFMMIKLDEYEKSVYLTQAENELVIEWYNGRNIAGLGYEQTEEVRRLLAPLNTIESITSFTVIPGLSDNSKMFRFGEDREVLFITQEQARIASDDPCLNGQWVDVIPVRRDIYNKIKRNPFKNKKVFRIDRDINVIELTSNYNVDVYKVSYLRKPLPIILENLDNGLTINGLSLATPCELPEVLHQTILERAVLKAFNYMATGISNKKE